MAKNKNCPFCESDAWSDGSGWACGTLAKDPIRKDFPRQSDMCRSILYQRQIEKLQEENAELRGQLAKAKDTIESVNVPPKNRRDRRQKSVLCATQKPYISIAVYV